MKQLKITISITAFVDVHEPISEVEFTDRIEDQLRKATDVANQVVMHAENKGFHTVSRNIETEVVNA